MCVLLLFLLLLLPLDRSSGQAQAQQVSLTILATWDRDGRLLPVNSFGGECAWNSRATCRGGVAAVAAYTDAIKTGNANLSATLLSDRTFVAPPENTLAIELGNFHFGTLWFTTFQGNASAQLLARMGYDLMSMSNTDFYTGQESLSRRLQMMYAESSNPSLPLAVVSNLNVADSSPLAGKLTRRGEVSLTSGVRVGFLSLLGIDFTTKAGDAVTQGLTELDGEEALIEEVANWDQDVQGRPDIIVLLSHRFDFDTNVRIARKVLAIDIVLVQWGPQIIVHEKKNPL